MLLCITPRAFLFSVFVGISVDYIALPLIQPQSWVRVGNIFFCCRFVFLFARRSFVESMDSHGDCCLVTCYFRFFLLCYNSRWVELSDVVFFLCLPDFFCSFSPLFSSAFTSARSTMSPNRSSRFSFFLITVLIPLPGWRSQMNKLLGVPNWCSLSSCRHYTLGESEEDCIPSCQWSTDCMWSREELYLHRGRVWCVSQLLSFRGLKINEMSFGGALHWHTVTRKSNNTCNVKLAARKTD